MKPSNSGKRQRLARNGRNRGRQPEPEVKRAKSIREILRSQFPMRVNNKHFQLVEKSLSEGIVDWNKLEPSINHLNRLSTILSEYVEEIKRTSQAVQAQGMPAIVSSKPEQVLAKTNSLLNQIKGKRETAQKEPVHTSEFQIIHNKATGGRNLYFTAKTHADKKFRKGEMPAHEMYAMLNLTADEVIAMERSRIEHLREGGANIPDWKVNEIIAGTLKRYKQKKFTIK